MQITKFNTQEAAQRYADNCFKAHGIILGDDGLYWVANLKTVNQLMTQGYEAI